MTTIVVIDGMGGSIGAQIVANLRKNLPAEIDITVLGTNAIAANNMIKAGANRGASGENAIKISVKEVDFIIGPVSIVIPNSMMGELSPLIAEAIASSPAQKILLPLSHPHIDLIGVAQIPLPHLMEEVVGLLKKKLGLEEEN
ncbi:MAG: DUF3842 family protein [Candidatus Subteraquimicrobiales bacterium]|nr:DUF3842 family protein [Candidatus Subteraquimicrobiales bacterium]